MPDLVPDLDKINSANWFLWILLAITKLLSYYLLVYGGAWAAARGWYSGKVDYSRKLATSAAKMARKKKEAK